MQLKLPEVLKSHISAMAFQSDKQIPQTRVFMAYIAEGIAAISANKTSSRKSFKRSLVMLATVAPSSFLITVSLNRCSAVKAANPNSPRKEMKIVSAANILPNRPITISLL